MAAVVLAGTPAGAQSTVDLARQVDSLNSIWRAALSVKTAFDDSVKRTAERFDTVRVGYANVVATPEAAIAVRQALTAAVARIERRYGAAARLLEAPASGRGNIAVRLDTAKSGTRKRVFEIGSLDSTGHPRLFGIADDSSSLADVLEQRFSFALRASGPRELKDWLPGPLPADTGVSVLWALRRVDLVSIDADVARRCFAGDLESCKAGLALIPVQNRATTYYTADERQRLVRSLGHAAVGISAAATTRCFAGNDPDCIELANRIADWSPMPHDLRAALVEEALRIGGPSARELMLRGSGSPSAQLAVIAGVPIDTLVARWHAHLVTARFQTENATPAVIVGSIVWTMVFAGLSLRSSRWR
jgi:hypothetical protein